MHPIGPDDARRTPEETAAERRPGGAPGPEEHAVSVPASCRTGTPHRCLPLSTLAPGRR
jgi:hypothetical protein